MATPISWRDIAAPSAGSANSLIQQSSRTFNNSFEGINNLATLAREQSIRQDQEQKQALANAQFDRIVNATDPNQLNDISFAGLGAQGANVADLLQGAKRQFSDIGNTNASTTGLINENNVFHTNNAANLELTGSKTRGYNADARSTEIGNLTLAERDRLDIQDKRISNFGSYNEVLDAQKKQQAGQPYYGVDARNRSGILNDNRTISGNDAKASQYTPIDAKQRSSFLPKQLQSGLDSDVSSRRLQLAQGNAATSNAATNAYNGQTSRQRLAFDKTRFNKGTNKTRINKGTVTGTGEFGFLSGASISKALKNVRQEPGQSKDEYRQHLRTQLLKGIENPSKNQLIQLNNTIGSLVSNGTNSVKTPLSDPKAFENLNGTTTERFQEVLDSVKSDDGSFIVGGVTIPSANLPSNLRVQLRRSISKLGRTDSIGGGNSWYKPFDNFSTSEIADTALEADPGLKSRIFETLGLDVNGNSPVQGNYSEQQSRFQGNRPNNVDSTPRENIDPKVLSAIINQLKINK